MKFNRWHPGTLEERFWAKVDRGDGCWTWTAARNNHDYGVLGIGDKKLVYAHRYSYELSNGPIPEGMFVCHSCDNPPCVNPTHLFLGTQTDNMQDSALKQRAARLTGEDGPAAKLTWEQAREIRQVYAVEDISFNRLAQRYGVNHKTVAGVIRGMTWRESDDPELACTPS